MKKVLPLLIAAAFASPAAMAHQAGDILVRGGLAFVSPQTSSDDVLGTGELDIDSNMQLGLTLSYMLTDNWGVELLAATPFSSLFRRAASSPITQLASGLAWALPASLTASTK